MYHVNLYVKTEKKAKFLRRIEGDYPTQADAAVAVMGLNKEVGVNLSDLKEGQEFYMYVKNLRLPKPRKVLKAKP